MDEKVIEVHEQQHLLETAGQVSTHLWYVWTEIALEHEWLAIQARTAYVLNRTDVSHIEDEMKAALVAVPAVTNSLDALQLEVAALGAFSSTSIAQWEKRRPKAHTAILETLVETFHCPELRVDVGPQLLQLYRLRNEVVHQRPGTGAITEHPVLAQPTTPAAARYTVERASLSIDLLLQIYRTIWTPHDGQSRAASAWVHRWQHGMDEFTARRGAKPNWAAEPVSARRA
jgi:hypothetical protein